MRSVEIIAGWVVLSCTLTATVTVSADELWGKKPSPDIICKNADEAFEIIESTTEEKNGAYSSKFSGKIVKLEGCWFDPLDGTELGREAHKEGVYMMCFRQGGQKGSDGTLLGNWKTLYTVDNKINFYIEHGAQAQGWKDAASFAKQEHERTRIAYDRHSKYDFYFLIVDRKSAHRSDGLTMPCAKLIFFESAR